MIKEIITDEVELSKKCRHIYCPTSENIETVISDLLDTARSHSDACVGLAANQIGSRLRVFVIKDGGEFKVIVDPQAIGSGGVKSGKEKCLSRPECKPITKRRFKKVRSTYADAKGVIVTEIFKGFEARVFQHELDHLNGILI